MITESVLFSSLRRNWRLEGVRVTVHNGGMGSQTWFVDRGDRRWVAKAVAPGDGVQFAGGMAIAQRLEQAGISAGAPVPAADGQLVVRAGDDWLALLTWVPGHELTSEDSAEQDLIGTTLADVHRALADYKVETANHFHSVDPAAEYLSLRSWLRPAITAALRDLDNARPDGSRRASCMPTLRREHSGSTHPPAGAGSLTGAMLYGPLLYDLASAVMYVGGPGHAQQLIQAYLAQGTLGPAEVQHGLAPMLRPPLGCPGELLRMADR